MPNKAHELDATRKVAPGAALASGQGWPEQATCQARATWIGSSSNKAHKLESQREVAPGAALAGHGCPSKGRARRGRLEARQGAGQRRPQAGASRDSGRAVWLGRPGRRA